MKKIIIANWKMKPTTFGEAKRLFAETKKIANKFAKQTDVIVCAPFVYLSGLQAGQSKALSEKKVAQKQSIKMGAQDVFWKNPSSGGAFTGEISVDMLKDLNVKYVIVGHSERREFLGETDEVINQKIKIVLKDGLRVIFCVGEKTRDENGDYLAVIKQQIERGLSGVNKKLIKNLIVAYEPVWAIGASQADTPEDLLQISIYIRKILTHIVGATLAQEIPIIYGGSADAKNAGGFMSEGKSNGFLVGRRSLDLKEFEQIIKISSEIKP